MGDGIGEDIGTFMQGISVTRDFYAIRIHFAEVLHAHINNADLLGVHAWTDSNSNFSIEYVMRGGTMLTEYTDADKWRSVLAGLEKVL